MRELLFFPEKQKTSESSNPARTSNMWNSACVTCCVVHAVCNIESVVGLVPGEPVSQFTAKVPAKSNTLRNTKQTNTALMGGHGAPAFVYFSAHQ